MRFDVELKGFPHWSHCLPIVDACLVVVTVAVFLTLCGVLWATGTAGSSMMEPPGIGLIDTATKNKSYACITTRP